MFNSSEPSPDGRRESLTRGRSGWMSKLSDRLKNARWLLFSGVGYGIIRDNEE